MINTRNITLIVITTLMLSSGCSNGGNDSASGNIEACIAKPTNAYVFDLPDHFPQFVESNNNPTTEQGVALGKRLYHDVMLSLGGPQEGNSCSSCHVQSTGFSKEEDFEGRAVLAHANLAWSNFFLWEGNISGSLEEIMDFEITQFFQANIDLFKADPIYQRMNCEAFGSSDILSRDMSNAMAQWMRTLLSYRSRYDRYLAGEVELTSLEKTGEFLFNGALADEGADCSRCHALPMATDHLFHNNGLEETPEGLNLGRFNVTSDPADTGYFKTPTLRNVELTAPYMHDGRFATLEDVINHYNNGVQFSDHLDPIMVTPDLVYNLMLSDREKAGLVAFLKTFTDTAYVTDPEFADPFQ